MAQRGPAAGSGLLLSQSEARALADRVLKLSTADETRAHAERTFNTLRTLRDELVARVGAPLPELSMGMTGDLEPAVAAGSTLVRVGTALFGERVSLA